MSSGFNVKNQSTGKVWQTESSSQDGMGVPRNLTKTKGGRLEEGQWGGGGGGGRGGGWGGEGNSSFHAEESQDAQSKEEVDISRLLFRGVRVINRNGSNINMKEKNWEEKGGQVVNAITRAGSPERLFPRISQVIEYKTIINIID